MSRSRLNLLGALLATALVAACEDVPFAPKWDADWYIPVPSEPIRLQQKLAPVTTVPPGLPAVTASDTSQQNLAESVGQLLDQQIRSASLIVTLTKPASLQFTASDTVIVARTLADLSIAGATRIVVPIAIASADASVTDTAAITTGAIAMLRQAAASDGTLFIEVRGRIQYTGSAPHTLTANDTIGVRLALLARIGVSTPAN